MLALLSLSLIPIAYTDFRYRYVHLLAIIAYTAVALGYFLVQRPVTPTELAMSYIMVAAVASASVGITYLRLRKRLSLKDIAGSGDLLFFLATPLLLPIKGLLAYLVLTCCLGLLHYIFMQRIRKQTITIPLAGWGAVSLVLYKITLLVW